MSKHSLKQSSWLATPETWPSSPGSHFITWHSEDPAPQAAFPLFLLHPHLICLQVLLILPPNYISAHPCLFSKSSFFLALLTNLILSSPCSLFPKQSLQRSQNNISETDINKSCLKLINGLCESFIEKDRKKRKKKSSNTKLRGSNPSVSLTS